MRHAPNVTCVMFVGVLSLAGCGGGESHGGETGGTTSGGATQKNPGRTSIPFAGGTSSGGAGARGGSSSATGAMGGVATSGSGSCAPWPAGKLLPLVGAQFYGSDPGPCAEIDQTSAQERLRTIYKYDEMGRLINAVSGENSVKVFGYDEQDRIVSLTDSSSSVTSVEYQGLSAHITPENGVGAHAYFLDASGYPLTTVEYAGVGTVRGTMTFVYENCRMVSMFYTKADGSLDPARGFTEIAYDDAGHIVTRTNAHTGRVVTYDYTCW